MSRDRIKSYTRYYTKSLTKIYQRTVIFFRFDVPTMIWIISWLISWFLVHVLSESRERHRYSRQATCELRLLLMMLLRFNKFIDEAIYSINDHAKIIFYTVSHLKARVTWSSCWQAIPYWHYESQKQASTVWVWSRDPTGSQCRTADLA